MLVQQSAYLFPLRLIFMCSLFSHVSRLNQRSQSLWMCGCALCGLMVFIPVANVLTQLAGALGVDLSVHTAVYTEERHLANKGVYEKLWPITAGYPFGSGWAGSVSYAVHVMLWP